MNVDYYYYSPLLPFEVIIVFPCPASINFIQYNSQVVFAEDSFQGVSDLSFTITLARAALVFNTDAILALYAGWLLLFLALYLLKFLQYKAINFTLLMLMLILI